MSVIQSIESIFAQPTSWQFTSSRGISGSFTEFGAQIGSLYLSNGAGAPAQELDYGVGGGSFGPLPAGLSFSTNDFWSSGIGNIRSRTTDPLAFSDMQGVICTVGLAGSGIAGVPVGLSAAMYFMGLPWYFAAIDLSTMDLAGLIYHGLTNARALGMMVGRIDGVDAGVSIQVGYAN